MKWRLLKILVWKRDGYRCVLCGSRQYLGAQRKDTGISRRESTIDNVITTCGRCQRIQRIERIHLSKWEKRIAYE